MTELVLKDGTKVKRTTCETHKFALPIGDEWKFVGESSDGKYWLWQRDVRVLTDSGKVK